MAYQFILNGTVVTDPIGWDALTFEQVWDDQLKGFFGKYTFELDFINDGYDLILATLNSDEYCGQITAEIKKQNASSVYETIFEGFIYLSSVTFDKVNCIAKCSIEDNSLGALIYKYKDTDIQLDVTNTFAGQAPNTSAMNAVDLHDSDDGTVEASINVATYFDAIQYCLDVITNNQVTLVSNLLSAGNAATQNIWTLTFDADFVAGNNIDLTFTETGTDGVIGSTTLEQRSITTVSFAVSHANTMNLLLYELLNAASLSYSTGTITGERYILKNYRIPTGTFSYAEITGARQITFKGVLPFELISCVVTGGASQPVATLAEAQAWNAGIKNLAITNGWNLSANTGDDGGTKPIVSLSKLIQELNTIVPVAFKISTIAGVPTFTLEKISTFLSSTAGISIDANSVELQTIGDFNHSTIDTNGGGFKNYNFPAWGQSTWYTGLCDNEPLDLKNDWITDSASIWYTLEQTATDFAEDDIFIIHLNSGNTASLIWPITLVDLLNPLAPVVNTYYPYNTNLTILHKMRYNDFLINGDPIYVRGLINERTKNILQIAQIESSTTPDDFFLALDNPDRYITVTYFGGTLTGWPKEMTYNIHNGKFELQLFVDFGV